MTRQEIMKRGGILNGEYQNTPGFDLPYNRDLWIDTACDDIARTFHTYYKNATFDIVSAQQRYCLPDCLRIDNVSYIDTNGKYVELTPMTPLDLDKQGQDWRNQPSGLPLSYATEGLTSFVMYPTPNFSLVSGGLVEGVFPPGSAGSGGTSVWPNPADICPLPVRAHVAVLWRYAYYRAMETGNPKMELFEKEFIKAKGMLERESHIFTAATQHADTIDIGPLSPAFNPLDL